MLFRVTSFSKERLCFYIVPDDPFEIPEAILQINGISFPLKPTEQLVSLVRSQRHNSGFCAFQFAFPINLDIQSVKVYEKNTNLLIFRHVADETSFFKNRVIAPKYWSDKWQMSQSFLDRFIYHYDYEKDVQSQETLSEILQNHCTSTCVFGNVPIHDVLYRLDDNIKLWVILDHPHRVWMYMISEIARDRNILDLKSKEIQRISNPLLKSIVQRKHGFIGADDVRDAYKILSQATLTTTVDSAFESDILQYNTCNNIDLSNSTIFNNGIDLYFDQKFVQSIVCKEDYIFYKNVMDVINSA